MNKTGEVSKLVDSWLGEDGDSSNSEDEQDFHTASRPSRLGLGAKFVPHAAAAKEQETKLQKRILGLQKRKPAEDDNLDDDAAPSSSEDEEDSRTQATSSISRKGTSHTALMSAIQQDLSTQASETSRKKKKRKKQKQQQSAANTSENGSEVQNSSVRAKTVEPGKSAPSKTRVEKSRQDGKVSKPPIAKPQQVDKPTTLEENERKEVPREKRKNKKTRSKQKNIRKDTRPVENRPNYRIALPKPSDGANRPNNWIFASLKKDPRLAGGSRDATAKATKTERAAT